MLFDLSIQLKYLLGDPGPRSELYREFTHVTRHEQSSPLAQNPTGLISQRVADSPIRPEGEERNKREFDRVESKFTRAGGRLWDKWYCMSAYDLANSVGRLGEYRVVYASCSAWAHGDPTSTENVASHTFTEPSTVFALAMQYYGRMLLRVAEELKIVLTGDQYQVLQTLDQNLS